ncbi:glutamate--tRNA ligase [bacterium]|nr:glutamate--tRNA ligase [bacterium]
MTIRTRFAPSPTGYLHLGGLRTALYNYLYSKKHSGKFILRIEDTDRNRFVPGAEEQLISTLSHLGIQWDEGPDMGGQLGPYRQSDRLDIYKKYINKLIDSDNAYYCFCSTERLKEIREKASKEKRSTNYDRHCLTLSKESIQKKLDAGERYVVRLKIPDTENIVLDDIIHGPVKFKAELIDDQIILKSDGYPTYHLANVVDDHLMQITHVIRGDEWLSSTPKHIVLYNAFKWEIPEFAHLPLILNADRSKLSKRQNDVAVENYLEKGFIPEGLLNYLALLGWSNKDDMEFFTLESLKSIFDLKNVSKSGCIFDPRKLIHINGLQLRSLDEADRKNRIQNYLEKTFIFNKSGDWINNFIQEIQERIKTFNDISVFFTPFIEKIEFYEKKPAKKFLHSTFSIKVLNFTADLIKKTKLSDHTELDRSLRELAENLEISFGKVAGVLRVALTGRGVSIGLFGLFSLLGKDIVLDRISQAIEFINNDYEEKDVK